MASHRLSLLTQREPDSLERNSICLAVAFIVAENMIEKAALPDRRCPGQRNMFRESLFQHSNPWPKLKIVGSANEKMNVIGHDHISANSNVLL